MSSYDDEKELVLRQAQMYLGGGKSLREIAKETGQSHVTVRRNLLVKLKEYNLALALEAEEKLDSNKEKTVNDEEISKRVLAAYDLLVNKNMAINEIAESLGSTEFTIYRDLKKRLPMILKISPKLVTQEMVDNVEKTLAQHSIDNSPMIKK